MHVWFKSTQERQYRLNEIIWGGLTDEKICRYSNSPTYVTARWPSLPIPPLNFFGADPLEIHTPPGFFSLKFLWGGSKFLVPVSPDGDEVRWGEGDLQKKSDWSQNCPPYAKLGHFFCYFKHEIQLTFELKSSQIWHKNVFKFFNFFFGGGTSLGPKTTSVAWGDWQNFRWMGDPQFPPRKKTLTPFVTLTVNLWQRVFIFQAHFQFTQCRIAKCSTHHRIRYSI